MQNSDATDKLLGKEELLTILVEKGLTDEQAEACYPEIANNFVTLFLANVFGSLSESDQMSLGYGVGDLDNDDKVMKMRGVIFEFMKKYPEKVNSKEIFEKTKVELGKIIIEIINKNGKTK